LGIVARELGAGMLLPQFTGMRVLVVGCGDLGSELLCSLLVWVQLLQWWLWDRLPLQCTQLMDLLGGRLVVLCKVKKSEWSFVVSCWVVVQVKVLL